MLVGHYLHTVISKPLIIKLPICGNCRSCLDSKKPKKHRIKGFIPRPIYMFVFYFIFVTPIQYYSTITQHDHRANPITDALGPILLKRALYLQVVVTTLASSLNRKRRTRRPPSPRSELSGPSARTGNGSSRWCIIAIYNQYVLDFLLSLLKNSNRWPHLCSEEQGSLGSSLTLWLDRFLYENNSLI